MSRADCTVRALAAVAGIAYALADEIAADGGRAPSRRVISAKVIEAAKARECEVLEHRLAELSKWYARGFIVPAQYEREAESLRGQIWLAEHAE